MRKFLLKCAFLCFIGLIFNFLIYQVVNDRYYKPYYKDISKTRKFKSFLFADSHGRPLENLLEPYGIFNYSIGSDSYGDILRKIKYLLRNDVKIEQIILSADDHTLSVYRERLSNHDRSVKLVDFNDYNAYLLFKEKYLSIYFPILNSKARDILILALKGHLSSDANSEMATSEWADENRKIERVESRFKQQFPDGNKSEKLIDDLKEIISISLENDIQLVGIKFPLSGDFVDRIGGYSYGADNILMEEGIDIFDYKTLFVDNDEYFEDQDHFNIIGSEILIDRLITDLRSRSPLIGRYLDEN